MIPQCLRLCSHEFCLNSVLTKIARRQQLCGPLTTAYLGTASPFGNASKTLAKCTSLYVCGLHPDVGLLLEYWTNVASAVEPVHDHLEVVPQRASTLSSRDRLNMRVMFLYRRNSTGHDLCVQGNVIAAVLRARVCQVFSVDCFASTELLVA